MAIKISGVSLKVEGADKFASDLSAAAAAMKQNSAEMKLLDATYKGAEGSEYYSKKLDALGKQLQEQQKRTETLRKAREAYAQQEGHTVEGLEQLDLAITNSRTAEEKLKRSIEACNVELKAQAAQADDAADGQKDLGDQAQQTGKKLRSAGEEAREYGKKLDDLAGKATKAGGALTKVLTVPIIGMGTAGMKFSLDFDDAMWETATMPGFVTGTLQEQQRQLDELGDELLAASDRTHVAATELAAGQYMALSSGVAKEESAYWAERSAMAAKAGKSDVETVIDGASSAVNAWGATAGGLDHVLDAMITTQNLGKTTVGELASQIGQVSGLAPQLKISFDEIMAATAALTANGLSTSSSITGLRGVMSAVIKPTSEAAETAEALGLEFSAAAVQAKGLTGFLKDVMDKTGGSSDHLGKLFGQVEGLNAVMMLGTSASELYASSLNEIATAEGVLDDAFALRISSRAEQLNGSLNKVKNAGIELAENLYPAVDAAAELLGSVAEFAGGMTEEQQRTALGLAGVAAAIGPVTTGFGKLLTLGKNLAGIMTGPWGWITAATVAIGGGLIYANQKALDAAKAWEDEFAGFDIGINSPDVAAKMAEIQQEIDAWTSTHELTATGVIVPKVDKEKLNADLTKAVDAAFADKTITVTEYAHIQTQILGVTGEALDAADSDDAIIREVAAQLQGAVDDYNALLDTVYRKGNSATDAEIAALETALERVKVLRAELTGLTASTEDAETQTYKSYYDMAKLGIGGEAAVIGGAVYVVGRGQMDAAEDAEKKASAEADYNEQLVEAEQSGATVEELKAIDEERVKTIAEIDKATREHEEASRQAQLDYANEVLAANQEVAASLEEGGDLIERANEATIAYRSGDRNALLEYAQKYGLYDADEAKLPEPSFWNGWNLFADADAYELNYLQGIVLSDRTKLVHQLAEWEDGFGDDTLDAVDAVIATMEENGLKLNNEGSVLYGVLADYMRVKTIVENGTEALGGENLSQIGTEADVPGNTSSLKSFIQRVTDASQEARAAADALGAAAEAEVGIRTAWKGQTEFTGSAHRMAKQLDDTYDEALKNITTSFEETGKEWGEGLAGGFAGTEPRVQEACLDFSEGVIGKLKPIEDERKVGYNAANSIRTGLIAATPGAVSAAANLAAMVNAQLGTIRFTGSLQLPSVGPLYGLSSYYRGGDTVRNDFSTNVTVQRATLDGMSSVSAFAAQIAAANAAKLTARGISSRGGTA